jgi:hypothetical protein
MSDAGATSYLFTGDRDWTDSYIVSLLLRGLWHQNREQGAGLVVVHGAGRGLDNQVDREADYLNLDIRGYPADWKQYGTKAGPIRNRLMLNDANPRIVFAFHDAIATSKGTADMVRLALAADKPTYLIKHASRSDL